jgi:hypothetical protein
VAKAKLGALLLIRWQDSCASDLGWSFTDRLGKMRPVLIETVGWVVKRTKKQVTLAQNVGGLEKGGHPQVCCLMTIPVGCIVMEQALG